MSEVIGEMEKGWNEKIVFSISDFKGKTYANIRIYYEDDESEWKPTKKGVTVSLDSFKEFKELVDQMETHLRDKNLI